MTRLIPPPGPSFPAAPLGPLPVGDLSAAGGWTLTDPSGIIAVAPASDGLEVSVSFNAIAGVAFLTRALQTDPAEPHIVGVEIDVVTTPVGATLCKLSYGLSDATGTRNMTVGQDMTVSNKRTFSLRNAALNNGNSVVLSVRSSIGLFAIADRLGASTGRGVANLVATGRNSGNSAVHDAGSSLITEESNDFECLRFETDGMAAEAVVWELATAISQTLNFYPAST